MREEDNYIYSMFNDNYDKKNKNIDGKYFWTQHSLYKIRQYGLSQQRVKRVIRMPERIEEGIVKNTVAVMQPVSLKRDKKGKESWKQEIWCMYQLRGGANSKFQNPNNKQNSKNKLKTLKSSLAGATWPQFNRVKIISAWRYPGVSPKNNPIPENILEEIQNSELW